MSRQGLIQGKYRHEDGLWDDIRVPAQEVINIPGPSEPVFLPFIDGTAVLWYDIGFESFFNIQMPHTWKIGTPIYPHVHWSTDGGGGPGDIQWELEWVDAPVFAPFPPGSQTMPSDIDSLSGPYIHEVVGFPAPIFPTGLSQMLICHLIRIPIGVGDYPGLIALLEIDFHFQKDDMGSVSQFNKG